MASRPDFISRDKLEEELVCSFCLERLKDPRVFPCQHSFCYKCIVDLSRGKSRILCPECRAEVEVGNPPDLSHFKRNPRVNNILECIALTTIVPGGSINCEIHEGEQYKYYCKTCQTPTCKDCTLQDHREHEYCPIHDIAKDIKKSLVRKLIAAREQKAELKDDILHLEKLEANLSAKNEQVNREINQHFDELVENVQLQRRKLIARANQLTESKLQLIGTKIEDLQLTQTCFQSDILDVETTFENMKDEEVLIMEKRVSKNLDIHTDENEVGQTSVQDDMKFLPLTSVEDFKKSLVESNLVANDNVCLEFCTISVEPKQLKKKEQAVVTVTCRDSSNCQVKYGGQIIKAEFSGSAIVRVVEGIDHKNGTHDVIFVPTSRGELTVKFYINGQEAPNCMLKTAVRRESKIFR